MEKHKGYSNGLTMSLFAYKVASELIIKGTGGVQNCSLYEGKS